jgi:hypothetical protein
VIKHSTFWWVSAALSATLVIVLLMLWMKMNQYELPQTLQANSYDTNSVIKEKWSSISGAQAGKIEPDITIKTGILFQSLKLVSFCPNKSMVNSAKSIGFVKAATKKLSAGILKPPYASNLIIQTTLSTIKRYQFVYGTAFFIKI